MDNLTASQTTLDYKHLFQALPGLYLILSPELHILDANDAYLAATLASKAEIVGKYVFDVFPDNPDQPESQSSRNLKASLEYVLEHRQAHTMPLTRYDVPSPAGTEHGFVERFWSPSNTPILGSDGAVACIIHEVRNVTDQVKIKHEKASTQHNLLLMAEAAGGAVWECDIPNNKMSWSSSYKELFGYDEEHLETVPGRWSELVHPDDLPQARQSIDRVLSGRGKTWTGQYRYRKADGSYTPVLDHGYILYDQAGKPVHMLGTMIDLSKQQEQERKLQESQLLFEVIAKATNDVIWDWNLLNDQLWWNEGFQTLYGYTARDIEPTIQSWTNRIHPEDLQEVEDSIYKVIRSGKTNWEQEYRFRCANGSYKILRDRGYVIHNAEGAPVRMIGAMVDITEEKRRQQQQEESIAYTRQVLESLPLMTWTADPDGATTYFSQSWYDYTGATFDELKAWGWSHVIHPDDAAETLECWQKSVAEGTAFTCENRWKSAEAGLYRWFLARAVPIRDEAGAITMWVGSHTDIHNQKLMQQQLEETTRQFRFLAESIPQIVWSTDPQGYHEYFNQRWSNYTGLTPEESVGFAWNQVLHPDDRQLAWDRWQHSLRTGEFYEIEYRFKNGSDGTYRWFLAQAMPMRDEAGNIVKWFGTCTDIEDHKKAEEELVEKNLELNRINQDLDSFIYTASHDLKLPIINMAGIFEELVRNAEFRDPDAGYLIDMFRKALRQIHNTIHDLSEVVRVQRTDEQEREQVVLQQMVEDVQVGLQDLITETKTQIRTDFSEVASISFPRANLKSIFFNLISNAIKYRAHDRAPEIQVSARHKGDYIEVQVQDNGIGIDMNKHQSKLFQMFKRFHNHVHGSGLGLYIVNRLLTNNGGYINIESTLNQGTTFYLYFKQKKS